MKHPLLITAILLFAGTVLARLALIPRDKLLAESDAVVVAGLSDVTNTSRNGVDYGSGILTVTDVLKGAVAPGQKLTLQWANRERISVRIDHTDRNGQTNIWLLQQSTNNTFTASYPGRVIDLQDRAEVETLLKQLPPVSHSPTSLMNQGQAGILATNLATTKKINLTEYGQPVVSLDQKSGDWRFLFTLKPPGKPGGHFIILVNKNGESRFIGGR